MIPAKTMPTGYGYCSLECAARHHILEEDIELQDFGNYEETDATVVMTSPDGGVRGEVLQVRDRLRKETTVPCANELTSQCNEQ